MECVKCESEFTPYAGKPGKINECPNCAVDIPLYVAEMGEGEDGTVETMTTRPIRRSGYMETNADELSDV